MTVTVTTRRDNADEACDLLSGWAALSNFIFGFITEQSRGVEIIGLFDVRAGEVERGQRKVVTWESGL